jgi:hypothetical protein
MSLSLQPPDTTIEEIAGANIAALMVLFMGVMTGY